MKRWNSSLTLWVRAYIYEPLEKKVQEGVRTHLDHTSYGNADSDFGMGQSGNFSGGGFILGFS